MTPRDPEPQLSPSSRPASSRGGIVLAAIVLALVATGSIAAVVLSKSEAPAPPTPTAPQARQREAGSSAGSSSALDPLVNAIGTTPAVQSVMKLGATIATAGGHVMVSFDHPVASPTNARAWIAIAKTGSNDSSYESWVYLEDGAQSAQLNAPPTPGDYEVRMHDDYPQQSYHVIQRLPFKVESGLAEDPSPPPPTSKEAEKFTLSGVKFATGAEIFATFPEPLVAKKGEKYWITIARASDSDSSYGGWQYLPSGATKTSMQAPSSAGRYEMRLHGNYPTKATNVVHRVPFVVD